MTFRVEVEQETDGRWIAEVVELSGALVYGPPATKRSRKSRLLRCVLSPTVSTTGKRAPAS
jgi:hypothetical protein